MVRSFLRAASLVTLSSLAAASACGDSGGSGTPAASQLYETWATTFCDILTSCPLEDGDLSFFIVLASADKSACRSFANRLFDQRRPEENIEKLIADGRVIYHGEQLGACLSAARSACSVDLQEVAACGALLEGTVATDGACWVSDECAGDAFCAQRDSDCVGACQPRPKRGEGCSFGGCSQSEGASACGSAGTCVPATTIDNVAVGAACGTESSDTDVTKRHCATGTYCDYDSQSDASSCVAYAGLGEACGDSAAECTPGLVCGGDGESGTCSSVTVANSAGASCNESDSSQPLVGCNVFARLTCDAASGTCKAMGNGSLGSACTAGIDLDGICDYGLYCDSATSKCTTPKADGAPCDSSAECTSGTCVYTDGETGTCGAASCD